MSCIRSMAKVTSQECVGKNKRLTWGTATASMYACGGTCTDTRGIPFTETQTRRIMSKDTLRITCIEDRVSTCTDATFTEDQVSVYTDVSTGSTFVNRSTCPYISTNYTDVHVGSSGHRSGRGPNMGRFCPSGVRLVYFLRKSTYFRVKRT